MGVKYISHYDPQPRLPNGKPVDDYVFTVQYSSAYRKLLEPRGLLLRADMTSLLNCILNEERYTDHTPIALIQVIAAKLLTEAEKRSGENSSKALYDVVKIALTDGRIFRNGQLISAERRRRRRRRRRMRRQEREAEHPRRRRNTMFRTAVRSPPPAPHHV